VRRTVVILVVGFLGGYVAEEAIRTLFILRGVEQERDTW